MATTNRTDEARSVAVERDNDAANAPPSRLGGRVRADARREGPLALTAMAPEAAALMNGACAGRAVSLNGRPPGRYRRRAGTPSRHPGRRPGGRWGGSESALGVPCDRRDLVCDDDIGVCRVAGWALARPPSIVGVLPCSPDAPSALGRCASPTASAGLGVRRRAGAPGRPAADRRATGRSGAE